MHILLGLLVFLPLYAEADPCVNEYHDLRSLRRESGDYLGPVFSYGGLSWELVNNFCRDTVNTCMWVHFAAFMCAPNLGTRCLPTLTSGDWYDASVSDEIVNRGKTFLKMSRKICPTFMAEQAFWNLCCLLAL